MRVDGSPSADYAPPRRYPVDLMVEVRVGIVSWNTAELLDRCLAALPGALGVVDAEVVVVDNASHDRSAAVARRHGVVVVENAENMGYARAMNQALGGTEAAYLIALNPDTEPGPGSLERLVATLRADPGIGLCVPRLLEADGSLQHSVYPFPSLVVAAALALPVRTHRFFGRQLWLEGHAPHDRAADIDWAIGAVHVIRRAAVPDPDHPYSERWFMYVEDVDLCWRLHRAGWRVRFEPAAVVVHVGNAAGAQAWGEERTARWMAATYDWCRTERGRLWTWCWGAISVAALTARTVVAAARGDRPNRRHLVRLLRINLREMRPGSGPG